MVATGMGKKGNWEVNLLGKADNKTLEVGQTVEM